MPAPIPRGEEGLDTKAGWCHTDSMKKFLLCVSLFLVACGLDPSKIASHRLFVTDGTEFVAEGHIRFAVVGNTRSMHPGLDKGRLGHGDVTHAVVGDITASALTGGPSFAVLMGDVVRSSSTAEWKAFDERFVGLIDGASAPASNIPRIPAISVAGDRDRAGDPAYRGLEAAFPGTGVNIGYGRVATWSQFDVSSGGHPWRFLVLDSGKAELGSRWGEQLAWIPGAVQGDYVGIVVLVHDPTVNLGGDRTASEATEILLGAIDEATRMDALKAVIFAGPAVSQVVLPEGAFGTIHIGAGGGGAPAEALHRSVQPVQGDRVALERSFDRMLQADLSRWSPDRPISDKGHERASATGSFAGTPGVYDAGEYPTYGWWDVALEGQGMRIVWRRWQPDGTFREAWSATYRRETGWTGGA